MSRYVVVTRNAVVRIRSKKVKMEKVFDIGYDTQKVWIIMFAP